MYFFGKRCGAILLSAVLFAVLVSSLLSGCRKNADIPTTMEYGLFTKKIKVDGVTRRYALYIPKDIGTTPVPLVLELHGGGIYIEDMTGESGYKSPYKLWMDIANREKFIVVYPEGLNGSYGKPTWHDCRADATVYSKADDVLFISNLIDKISSGYAIDYERVYVSGTSNGGLMALRLAIELVDRLAAVAMVGAFMPAISECKEPTKPISVLFMHGTADNHLPYNGGVLSNPPNPDHGTVYPVETAVQIWRDVDQTGDVPAVYTFADLDPNDGGTVTKYAYLNGVNGTEVVLYKIYGGGHSAPSIRERYSKLYERYFGRQNHDIEMTMEIWSFFKDKRNI